MQLVLDLLSTFPSESIGTAYRANSLLCLTHIGNHKLIHKKNASHNVQLVLDQPSTFPSDLNGAAYHANSLLSLTRISPTF